jgi:putative MATE family efflux protein
MPPIRREVAVLTRLATPVALTQLSSMLLWTIDLLMVGRIGVQAINAVSLGRLWVMGTSMVAVGLLFGIDPIATQAHGARDRERLGGVLLHGGALALLASLPLALLWLAAGPVLLAFGQDPATVEVAARYVAVQIPALPLFLLFMLLRQYLQARGIVRPAMWIAFGSIGFNAAINAVLIFGLFGFPRLGAVGAGIGTAISQAAMLAALVVAIRRHRLQRGSVTVLDPRALRGRRLAEIATLGAPVALQIALEYWAFAIASLWVGRMGAVELAAHSIALNLASLSYMVPLGISSATTTRVGHRIGAGDGPGAGRAARVALALDGTNAAGGDRQSARLLRSRTAARLVAEPTATARSAGRLVGPGAGALRGRDRSGRLDPSKRTGERRGDRLAPSIRRALKLPGSGSRSASLDEDHRPRRCGGGGSANGQEETDFAGRVRPYLAAGRRVPGSGCQERHERALRPGAGEPLPQEGRAAQAIQRRPGRYRLGSAQEARRVAGGEGRQELVAPAAGGSTIPSAARSPDRPSERAARAAHTRGATPTR